MTQWILFWLLALTSFSDAFVQVSPGGNKVSCRHDQSSVRGGNGKLFMSIPDPLDTLTSGLASIVRLPNGVTVLQGINNDAAAARLELKQLYDVENNNSCRKVRERITELDLVVEKVIPAADNSRVFTDPSYPFALAAGTTIPRLVAVDSEGSERVLSGEEEILAFFDASFPDQTITQDDNDDSKQQILGVLRNVGGQLAGLLRTGRGTKVSPAAAGPAAPRPNKPLILYSYEGNQFCRLVREVLTELDIVYELRSAGKESPRRGELAEIAGSSQCPYLVDPNTDVSMAESADIVQYLYDTYALFTPPNEILQWASEVVLPLAKPIFAKLTTLQAAVSNENDPDATDKVMAQAKNEIEDLVQSNPVVVFTYSLSPFSKETKAVLDRLNIAYVEKSLGAEWIPGLLAEPQLRAALLEMTGQSSLPHIFVGGKSIGGLFSGTPGLLTVLEEGKLLQGMLEQQAQT